jgi:diguanylate cyclase (GGDEF)-like protein
MAHLKPDECLNFVTEVLGVLRSTNQHEKVCSLVVDRLVRLFACQSCAVVLVDPSTEYLRIAHSEGISHTFVKEYQRRFATGAVGRLLWTGGPILIPDAASQPGLAAEVRLEHEFLSCCCVPIVIDERVIGYVHADSREPEAFAPPDLRTVQGFADFVGLALNKSRLFEENLRLDTVDRDTGLKKYPAFLERLQEALAHAAMAHEQVAVLLMDVDNYKHIALTFGTDAGRRTLREMADEMRALLRPMDVGGRYGFDEFILLRVHTSASEAMAFGEEVRRRIEARTYGGQGIRSSVSVGVAIWPEHGAVERDLLLSVREALYDAQRSGRNRVCVHATALSSDDHAVTAH